MTPDRKSYYEHYWAAPIHASNPYLQWKTQATVEHPHVRQSRAILDVGCGPGAVLDALKFVGARRVGVEMSAEAASTLAALGLEGVAADLEEDVKLPFPDATFDTVLCFDVFEHLFAPARLLREIRRVLKPNGRGFFCVPNALNGYNRARFVLGRFVDIMDTSHHEGEMFSNHIRLFSKELFEQFLASEGFGAREKKYYFPEAFNDETQRLPKGLAKLVTVPRLHERWPALWSMAFFFVCEKI
jgi:SAM-dependent methyltransferase